MSLDAAAPERVIAQVRRQGRVLVVPALLFIAAVGAGSYLMLGWAQQAWQVWTVLGGFVAVVTFGCLAPYFNWLGQRATITTKRVIVRRGVVVRLRHELVHARGYEVVVRVGPAQRLFGTGDLLLHSGDAPPVRLRDIPRPGTVHNALQSLIERAPRPVPEALGGTVAWGRR
ncbi:MAG TPA: PH domain-containing protein [Candidatus Lumbricidophila sp.]|nr:PH domain-containing protein [Candidatus Lumbricidophila sp.]